ncbi:DUF2786 domain-containing protein [Actinokineospora auranticolor]|uniref:Uncharacterized protein DUF2786 n=1 Tax=Actinokineospora auranticolor TaxID=155976 RepID=A0A2S6GE42_9PSEU|nr:DUF2786 domain-containing protein [Actinokineospora auranticolor]PPK63502.1 uncharacterized protein DUF2786 [Actinokineospora auranticolor]
MATTRKTAKDKTAEAKPATADKAAIKRKVAALLAQAEDKGVTPEEAQAFAAKAAELLARYSLDAATLRAEKGQKPEPVSTYTFTVSGQGCHGKARTSLHWFVAEAVGCMAVTKGDDMTTNDRLVIAIGTASMIDTLKTLLPWIMAQAENSARLATPLHMSQMDTSHLTTANRNIIRRDYFRSYLKGYGQGAAEKIRATRTDLAEEVKNSPKALVLVRDADRISAEFARRFPKTVKGRGSKTTAAGHAAGVRAGRAADTNQGKVNTTDRKRVGK